MKKIFLAIACFAAALTLNAQDARHRTVETIVVDVLAAMPAQNSNDFATQISDLAAAAPESVVKVASMMKPAAEGVKNNLCEYALTGLSSYVSANKQYADQVREGFTQAIKATADPTNKAFLMTQMRPLATLADAPLFLEYVADADLGSTAIGALVDIPGTEDILLNAIKAGKGDKALLASAAAEKGLAAAEPILQGWLGEASSAPELRAICSSLASIGSASSLDVLKTYSTPDYAALAVDLANGRNTKAVAKAAKSLLESGVSAYKSAGALAQMKNNPAKALKTLASAVSSDDIAFRNSVINDASSIVGTNAVATLLTKKFSKLTDDAKVDVLSFLGNNKVASAESLVASLVDSDNSNIANAAIAAAGKIGGKQSLNALASQLAGKNGASALSALKSYKGDIQDAIGTVLDKELAAIASSENKDSKSLINIVNLISSRRLTGLAPKMYELAQSSDSKLATFGQAALASVVGAEDIDKLSALVDGSTGDATALYTNALQSALNKLASQDQYSKVSNLISSAKNPSRFFNALAASGTDEAVQQLKEAFDQNADKAAFSALCGIKNYKAAEPLLSIAQKYPEYTDHAIENYTYLVSNYESDPDLKRECYAKALSIAQSPDTKYVILKDLSNVPTMKSFLLAGKFLEEADSLLSIPAADAVKRIATNATEELDYNTLKTNLEKAAKVYQKRGLADDEYALKEIDNLLSKAEPSPVSELTDEEKKQGFEMLFDGTNLDKWQGDKDGYIPMNGTIYVSANYGSTGNLYTAKEYRNFVYRFEFCFLREGVNNGVGIRTPMGVDAAYDGMCECQILDHDADIYSSWLREYQVHGSVYGVIPATRIVHKPLGEWSTEEIRVEGDHIKVTVNGQVIVDGDIRKACKGHNVAPDGSDVNPYTVDHRNHPGMFNKKGYISFCGHGEGLKIRNVRILDLGNKK